LEILRAHNRVSDVAATTASYWNGLTVDQWFLLSKDDWDNLLADHVPTNAAISPVYILRRDEPYAMHVALPESTANFTHRG